MSGITTRFAALALAAGIAVSLAGCAESTQSKTCAQADKVRSSIEDVRNVNLSENGMVALRDSVAQVGTALELLRSELEAAAQAQIAAVQIGGRPAADHRRHGGGRPDAGEPRRGGRGQGRGAQLHPEPRHRRDLRLLNARPSVHGDTAGGRTT